MEFSEFLKCLLLLATLSFSCNSREKKTEAGKIMVGKKIYDLKPGSSYSDTIKIEGKTAVFFNPDSIQIEKIRKGTNGYLYEAFAHDCFYQEKAAKSILVRYWTNIKVVENPKVRFLLFVKNNRSMTLIDLDKTNEMCGLILFDPAKDPESADMMNAATALGFYFGR